jgi:diacylglycerol kinase family enzyme
VLNGHARAIDVGKVEDRHFLNIVGFGYDVAVLEDSWNVSYLEGSALYLYCAVKQLGSTAASRSGSRPTASRRASAR